MAAYLCSGFMHLSCHRFLATLPASFLPRILSPPDVPPFISCLSHRPPDLLLTGVTSIQTQAILSTRIREFAVKLCLLMNVRFYTMKTLQEHCLYISQTTVTLRTMPKETGKSPQGLKPIQRSIGKQGVMRRGEINSLS